METMDLAPILKTVHAVMADEFDVEYAESTVALMETFSENMEFIGWGRTRVVFDRGDGYVVKVPFNGEGYMANGGEYKTYTYNVANPDNPGIPVAACNFEDFNSMDKEIPVLIMEKVTYAHGEENLPDWVGWVDCGQVGYTKNGELVAYDL